MSRDLDQLFRSLGDDADQGRLTGPAELRRRGERRTRLRAIAAVAAIAVLVGGVAVGSRQLLAGGPDRRPRVADTSTTTIERTTPSPAPTTASPAPSSTASGPPAISDAPAPTSIAARAFLQPPDTGLDDQPYEVPRPVIPSLCGAEFGSDSAILVRRTKHVFYGDDPPGYVPDGTFDQTITSYEGAGATGFMTELREAVAACPRDDAADGEPRYALAPRGSLGDEVVRFSQTVSTPVDPVNDPNGPQRDSVTIYTAIRVDGVVTVLRAMGWEGSEVDPEQVHDLVGKAVVRLRNWVNG
jgi:hypothetical protein